MVIVPLNPNRTGFFDIFRFGGGGEASAPSLSLLFVALFATKFCTGIDSQSISSNMEKLYKVNDVIDNDVIIVRKLAEKTVTRA